MGKEYIKNNNFDIVNKIKKYIINNTDIASSIKEMAVLDNILSRLLKLGILNKSTLNIHWYKYNKDNLPPLGDEVLAYNKNWINDYNPKGIRIGFYNAEGTFTSAYWWDHNDDYISIDKEKYKENPSIYNENNLDKTEPEWWTFIPDFPKEYENINI